MIYQLTGRAPQNMIWLIAAGGLIYTLGVPVYLAKKMPFSTAIWHGLVVVASACLLAAIAIGAQNIQ